MPRTLLRLAMYLLAAPLLLCACRDNADPVKPRVGLPAVVQSAG